MSLEKRLKLFFLLFCTFFYFIFTKYLFVLQLHYTTNLLSLKMPLPEHILQDPKERVLLQRQLVCLLHATGCLNREKNDEPGCSLPCQLPFCDSIKKGVRHFYNCQTENCTFKNCTYSLKLILHWRNCKSDECVFCGPVKVVKDFENINMVKQFFRDTKCMIGK